MTGTTGRAHRCWIPVLWRRPWYYPQMGEGLEEAYIREATAVRESVGFTDVSTLGKIAVQGPDAGDFSGPHLCQRIFRAAGRPGALRGHAAG